jgi:uncharacterized protein
VIIDAHAHLSSTDYGCAQTYLKQLEQAGIDRGVAVPGAMLDVRKMTDYITGKSQPDNPVPDNLYIQETMQNHHNIDGFVCIDPHQNDSLQILENSRKQGFSGLKLSPLSHQFTFSSKRVKELAQLCSEYEFPIYSHVVYSPGASTSKFVQLAKQFPKTNFIIGHMGFGPADQEAIDAAKSLPNFFLETSTGNFLNIQEAVKKVGSSKVIFGSEYPLSHPAIELQKILILNISDQERSDILAGNIKNLLKLK